MVIRLRLFRFCFRPMTDTPLKRLAHKLYHSLPCNFGPDALALAVSEGMLPKSALEDGKVYIGHCRNASQARWDAARERFVYRRTKFGRSFDEDIVHPEDDKGFDVFVPVSELTPVRGT